MLVRTETLAYIVTLSCVSSGQIHIETCCDFWNRLLLVKTKALKYKMSRTGTVWTRQIWGIWKLRPAYSPETPNLGQNRWCFVPFDLEIWWMTLENNRASLLCCFKLSATFHSHWWIQTGVTVRKRPIWVKFDDFLEPCDLEIWRMTLKNNRAPPLCYFKLYASFRSHRWIQAGVTVRKRPIWVKIDDFFLAMWPCNLTYDLEKQ